MSDKCHICEREEGPGENELNESGLCLHCQISHELLEDVTSGDKERIKKLESTIQDFIDKMGGYTAKGLDGIAMEAWIISFKQLLETNM